MHPRITAILIVSILLASGMFLMETDAKPTSVNGKEIPEEYDVINLQGMELNTKSASEEKLSLLKKEVGVRDENVDYNPKIDGYGTGLRPPSNQEWDSWARDLKVVVSIDQAAPDALNTSKLHNQSDYFPPIGNQGSEGSCVSWSMGYYTKTFQEAKEHDWNLSGASYTGSWPGHPTSSYQDKIMSPDFLYHQINNGQDTGSYYSDNQYVCQRTGISSWKKMPYDDDDSTTWPSEDAWREAPLYRCRNDTANFMWTTSNSSISNLKKWIDGDNLASISINAYRYSSLVNETWNKTVPCGTGRNHANTVIGYDDNFGPYTEDGVSRKGAFLVANSWGTGWTGDTNKDGLYWITYECMRTQVKYVYILTDKIDYEPKALALFKMSHSKRGECQITLGVGSKSSPDHTKRFDDYLYDGGDQPYPSNTMAQDITEFSEYVSSLINKNYFIKVYDGGSSTTGSIQSFSLELYDDYSDGADLTYVSSDPVVNTVQSSNVYAELKSTDDIYPELKNDATPSSGTTGDPLTFSINVTDNGFMDSVYVNYSIGSGPSYNLSMNESWWNHIWTRSVILPHSLDNITYSFHAVDGGNNWNGTSPSVINVNDNDLPELIPYVPSRCTTGDPLNITVNATDNIGMDYVEAYVDYQNGSFNVYNLTLGDKDNWSKTVTVEDLLVSLKIYILAYDSSGNRNGTGEFYLEISDNDAPVLNSDMTPSMGTTGDPFLFNFNVSDNIELSSVSLDYWFDDRPHQNLSLMRFENYSYEITIPSDSVDTLHYSLYTNDTSENEMSTGITDVMIYDNDRPTIISDFTSDTGTTGDQFTFDVATMDNIGMESAYVEYWFKGGIRSNVSMLGENRFLLTIDVPGNSTELNYIFHLGDSSGNWNHSDPRVVEIRDNDLPELTDFSSNEATTGDPFSFQVEPTDNMGIGSAYVLYGFGSGDRTNLTLEEADLWYAEITIPENSVEPLRYSIHVSDLSGNWNASDMMEVTVLDNDLPVVLDLFNEGGPTTGDPFELTVFSVDNIGIGSCELIYRIGNGPSDNLTHTGPGPMVFNISIPSDSEGVLEITISLVDTSGNTNQSSGYDFQIVDDDSPSLISMDYPAEAGCGSEITISSQVSDNIGVNTVKLEYWFGLGEKAHSWMLPDGGSYKTTISIPGDSLYTLSFSIDANDSASNRIVSDIMEISIYDGIDPVIARIDHTEITEGTQVNVTVVAEDNIGIDKIEWTVIYEDEIIHTYTGSVLTWEFPEAGQYQITVVAFDAGGNSADLTETVTALEADPDRDGDGIENDVEKAHGLDPDDPSDAYDDPDGDELNNLEEIEKGTDINSEDSDGDGMDDGWEVSYDLDPLIPSSDQDTDGDGITDLEEYNEGSDPTRGPVEDEEEDFTFIVILIAVATTLILIVMVAGLTVYFAVRSRGKEEEWEEEETASWD